MLHRPRKSKSRALQCASLKMAKLTTPGTNKLARSRYCYSRTKTPKYRHIETCQSVKVLQDKTSSWS